MYANKRQKKVSPMRNVHVSRMLSRYMPINLRMVCEPNPNLYLSFVFMAFVRANELVKLICFLFIVGLFGQLDKEALA